MLRAVPLVVLAVFGLSSVGCPLNDAPPDAPSCVPSVEVDWSIAQNDTRNSIEASEGSAGNYEFCGDQAWHPTRGQDECLFGISEDFTELCPEGATRYCADCGDADCVLIPSRQGSDGPECTCLRQCVSSADCLANQGCMCAQWSTGEQANRSGPPHCFDGCATDEDCAAGESCWTSVWDGRFETFHCTTANDECVPWEFCPPEGQPHRCRFDDAAAAWKCQEADLE